jgi:hypothetical protein
MADLYHARQSPTTIREQVWRFAPAAGVSVSGTGATGVDCGENGENG